MKENKRVGLTQKGNKKALLLTYLVVLTASQEEKLSCKPLLPDIERIAKKLEIDWAVELSANVEYNTLAVSRVYETEIGEYEFRNIENVTHNFLEAIDRLDLPQPAPEPECPSHESEDEEEMQSKQFIEKLLHDLNLPSDDYRHVCGALIIDSSTSLFCPELTGWGHMSYDLLKEMCELYLKAHEE